MDVLCQAKSGMGKTAVFVITVLQQLDPVPGEVGAVVMCHTRELAVQTAAVLGELAAYEKQISIVTCCGSLQSKKHNNANLMKCGSFLMVGTPGRCLDIFNTQGVGTSIASAITHVVLDEADNLLHESFQATVRDVMRIISAEAAACVCSATMPHEVLSIATRFQNA